MLWIPFPWLGQKSASSIVKMTSSWKHSTSIDTYLFDFMQTNLETVWTINQISADFYFIFQRVDLGTITIGTWLKWMWILVMCCYYAMFTYVIVCILDELKVNHKEEIQALDVHKQTFVTLLYTHPAVTSNKLLTLSVQQYTVATRHNIPLHVHFTKLFNLVNAAWSSWKCTLHWRVARACTYIRSVCSSEKKCQHWRIAPQ